MAHYRIDGEMVIQDEHGITDFYALRSASYLHGAAQARALCLRSPAPQPQGYPFLERRARLRKLTKSDKRSPIQFSDHLERRQLF